VPPKFTPTRERDSKGIHLGRTEGFLVLWFGVRISGGYKQRTDREKPKWIICDGCESSEDKKEDSMKGDVSRWEADVLQTYTMLITRQ
jgi:hypothetical protein